jgi:hypothetical protein
MPLSEPKYHEILLRLADAGVDVIVVGMAAAVIQGAPTMTWDLDVVHHRTRDNVDRLLGVLEDIDAVARGDSRRRRPNASHLLGPVIGLGELLQIKKRAGRPKDLAGIPYIEATVAELSRQK